MTAPEPLPLDPRAVEAAVEALRDVAYHCGAECWSCMCNYHYDPPQRHDWADDEDVKHAADMGQPSPVCKRCACHCAEEATP